MNILLVEDDPRVADFLHRGLRAEGHRCEIASDGEEGLAQARLGGHDVIVLDRGLPRRDGLSLCRQLRREGLNTPVLMLTALDAVEDRIDGLRAGADDYLPKPFDFDELLARLEALHRRHRVASAAGEASSPRSGDIAPLRIDALARKCWAANTEVELTALEFDLLNLFYQRRGEALSRERIYARVWGQNEDPLTNIVDVYVRRLRRKLGPAGECLTTLRGIGYRME